MDPRMRIVTGVMIAVGGIVVAALLFLRNEPPSESSYPAGIVEQFMSCLPEETTETQRGEINGIVSRFYDKATSGKIAPQDMVEIENDIKNYISKGKIPKAEIFDFMSKIGEATRRMDPQNQESNIQDRSESADPS